MVAGFCLAAFLLGGPAQSAVAAQPAAASQPAGLETPWDVRNILAGISADIAELKTLVAGMQPQQWHDRGGAPTTYILQWQTAQRQLNDVAAAGKLFTAQTESLPLALDEYFRLEALEVTLRSLTEGALSYGDRPAADHINQLLARDFNQRERLRAYLSELASSTEQNFKIADAEAQRCRGIISKEPPPVAKKSRR